MLAHAAFRTVSAMDCVEHIDAARDGDRLAMAGGGSIAVTTPPSAETLKLGLRSDAVRLENGSTGDGFSAQVVYTEYLGDNAYVYARLADGTQVSVRTAPDVHYAADEAVTVSVRPGGAHYFDAETGRRLDA